MKYMLSKTLIVVLMVLVGVSSAGAEDLDYYLRSGGMLLLNENYKQAIASYTEAIKIDPDNFEALKNLGVAFSALGNQDAARQLFERAYKINPLDPDLTNNLGVLFSTAGDGTKAIEYFEKALKLDSVDAVVLLNLAQEYNRLGKINKSLPLLRRADSLVGENRAVLFELGNSFATSGALDSSEVYYEKCLAAEDGASGKLHYFLATVKQKLGKMKEAEEHYRLALTFKTDHIESLQGLGMICFRNGRFAESVEQFSRTVAADSTHVPGLIGLGAACAMNGMHARADDLLHQLFAIDSVAGFQMLRMVKKERMEQKRKDP